MDEEQIARLCGALEDVFSNLGSGRDDRGNVADALFKIANAIGYLGQAAHDFNNLTKTGTIQLKIIVRK